MLDNIINTIRYDLYIKKFTQYDYTTFIREDNTDFKPIIFSLYIKNESIEIYNESYELLGIISYENWINDWNKFKENYWDIIDEYYRSDDIINNLCNYMSGL
jgi:hypothetical protein